MKSLVLLVALSLMLVAATVAVTLPDTVHAKKPDGSGKWCIEGGIGTGCAPTKEKCEALWSSSGGTCVRQN